MGDKANKQPPAGTAFDPQIQTENIAFARDELLACSGCGRANPPNRLKCIYCAAVLDVPAENQLNFKPNLRKLETWEAGFNVILREQPSEINGTKAAGLLSLEKSDLAEIIQNGPGLPLARVETNEEAEMLQRRLLDIGLKCTVVKDVDLAADSPPTRVRSIDLLNYQLAIRDFNTEETDLVGFDRIALIVRGQISKTRVDSNEKKRRRGTDVKMIDEYATVSDESVVDIYTFEDRTGFRIYPAGFDFSCLGDQKTLLAKDNFGRLVNLLTEHCPKARLVSSYPAIRHALGHVWEIESRKDSLGLRQIAIGKREFGSIASTSNLRQFTKFSRLQWHLL